MEVPIYELTYPRQSIECKYTDLTHPLDSMSILELMQPIIKGIFALGIAFYCKDNLKDFNENMERLR